MKAEDIVKNIEDSWGNHPQIIMIAALASNPMTGRYDVIGKGGDLPWDLHFKADMDRFRELTTGNFVLMGRKTYDSIGFPLPKRHNIVLTRQESLPNPKPKRKLQIVNSLESALSYFGENGKGKQLYIIGGQQVYEMCLPIATKLMLTHIHQDFEGDTFFPNFVEYNDKRERIDPWQFKKKEELGDLAFVDYVRSF